MPAGSGDRWPEDYERGRPDWPPDAVRVAGLAPEAAVLDLGAGTGKLTRLLLSAFEHVTAVEPSDPMRRVLARLCPEATALPGTGPYLFARSKWVIPRSNAVNTNSFILSYAALLPKLCHSPNETAGSFSPLFPHFA